MALCLKKLKNLNKVKLIDANFLWTEPHSKRIKVKLSIQVIYSYVVPVHI
jgi:nonsense-mediated mRNA decay protein 3